MLTSMPALDFEEPKLLFWYFIHYMGFQTVNCKIQYFSFFWNPSHLKGFHSINYSIFMFSWNVKRCIKVKLILLDCKKAESCITPTERFSSHLRKIWWTDSFQFYSTLWNQIWFQDQESCRNLNTWPTAAVPWPRNPAASHTPRGNPTSVRRPPQLAGLEVGTHPNWSFLVLKWSRGRVTKPTIQATMVLAQRYVPITQNASIPNSVILFLHDQYTHNNLYRPIVQCLNITQWGAATVARVCPLLPPIC